MRYHLQFWSIKQFCVLFFTVNEHWKRCHTAVSLIVWNILYKLHCVYLWLVSSAKFAINNWTILKPDALFNTHCFFVKSLLLHYKDEMEHIVQLVGISISLNFSDTEYCDMRTVPHVMNKGTILFYIDTQIHYTLIILLNIIITLVM